jgi:hypothetical protein
MKKNESPPRHGNEHNILIRRELYLMLAVGILICVMIAWSTAGISIYPFYIRLTLSVICVVTLNLIAYFIKMMK